MNKVMRPNHNRSLNNQDKPTKPVEVCQGCQKPIKDRYLLNSLGRNWHEDCLKCTCCEARLGEVGASLYTRANLILCKRDYLRLFGSTGHCSACNKVIPAFEMVMRARTNVYHLECFACQFCGHRCGRMTLDIKSESQKNASNGAAASTQDCACAGCGKKITDRFFLKACELFWHEDCLKCGCCDCRLGEVGSTLYTKANLILCKRDYLRLFGNTGYCSACNKVIPAFEMVMRAKHNVYHLECFACQQCNHRFCVGDRFYLCENKILCEYDYEERLVFANMAYNPPSIAAIKRHLPPPVRAPRPSPSTGHMGMNHRNGAGALHPSTPNGDGTTRLTNGYPPTSDHQIFEAK